MILHSVSSYLDKATKDAIESKQGYVLGGILPATSDKGLRVYLIRTCCSRGFEVSPHLVGQSEGPHYSDCNHHGLFRECGVIETQRHHSYAVINETDNKVLEIYNKLIRLSHGRFSFKSESGYKGPETLFTCTCNTCGDSFYETSGVLFSSNGVCDSCEDIYFSSEQILIDVRRKYRGKFKILGIRGDFLEEDTILHCFCKTHKRSWFKSARELLETECTCSVCKSQSLENQSKDLLDKAVQDKPYSFMKWVIGFTGPCSIAVWKCKCGNEFDASPLEIQKGIVRCGSCKKTDTVTTHLNHKAIYSRISQYSKSNQVVYALLCEERGIVKIGKSSDHISRISQLRKSTPFEFELYGIMKMPWDKRALDVEKSIHTSLTRAEVPGRFDGSTEWFVWDSKTKGLIDQYIEYFK